MPRINIEPSLFSDQRFINLMLKIGCQERALGAVILAFITAQKFWFPDKKPIPKIEWSKRGLNPEIIVCGLAKEVEDGFYICGSEEQFSWLFKAQKSGKMSALARKEKFGTAQPNVERCSNVVRHSPEALRTSSSSSSSSSKKRIHTPDSANPVFDFEALYKEYPRKEGKSRGLTKCRASIKTPDEYSQLSQAIRNYKKHLAAAGTEPRFVKHFGTFMTEWRDWLDPEQGKTRMGRPALHPAIEELLAKESANG